MAGTVLVNGCRRYYLPLHRRSGLSALASLVILNLLLRYPSTPHELGVDSFLFHSLASSLQANGLALWTLNPLSYLGLFPLSHPSGGPFLVVAVSDLSGVPIEGAILVVDLGITTLAVLGAFVLGLEFTHDVRFALLMSFVFSLTPTMISGLTWQIPTRIMFTTLLPFFLWLLIRLARNPQRQHAFFFALFIILMAAFHRLTVLVSLVAVSYVLTGIVLIGYKTLRLWKPRVFYRRTFVRGVPILAVSVVGSVAAGTVLFTGVLSEYSASVVVSGTSPAVQLLNLGISLARSSGILLPVAIAGLFALTVKRNKGLTEPFMILALLTFTPMLFLREYTGFYTVPFTSLFVAYGLYALGRSVHSNRLRAVGIILVLSLVAGSSAAISAYNVQATSHMSDGTYSMALYVRVNANGAVIANEGLIGSRASAVSGVPFLPVGGATTAFQSPELLMFGFVNRTNVLSEIRLVPFTQLTIDSDSPFELPGVQAEADWAFFLLASVDSIPQAYTHYDVHYALESRSLEGQYTAYANFYPSLLLQTAHQSRYAIYQDSEESIFFLGE